MKNLLTVVMFFGLFACGGGGSSQFSDDGDESERQQEELPQVTVVTVERGVFMHELRSNGRLVAVSKTDLRFRSSELITFIYVRNGQYVAAGEEIARIDDFELKNRVVTAEAAVQTAISNLTDFLLLRGYTLEDSATMPKDILQRGYSESQLLTARVNLAQARHNLQHAVLRSPIAGVVANITSKEHNLASTSEPFCTIIGNNRFDVEFSILEIEIELLKASHEVLIEPFAYPGTQIKGTLSSMNPVVDRNGMIQAKAVVNNVQGALYEGMNVRVLVQQAVPDKLVVPKQAVVMRSDRQVLFVYANGRSQWRYIRTGLENSREFTIEEQLEAGEQVIVSGNFNLAHDVEVYVIE